MHITTKYLPATDHKGSRIKATCENGENTSVTIGYPHELDALDAHVAAADALCAKLIKRIQARGGSGWPWTQNRIASNGDRCVVHVLVPETVTDALRLVANAAGDETHGWTLGTYERENACAALRSLEDNK